MDCLFCKIIAGEIPCHKMYEDEKTFAFLDIGPVSEGHTLVVPKAHATNLNEGTREDAVAVMATVHAIAPAIMRGLGASGYNLGMNHGLSAGQDVMHTHVHIMPRKDGVERTFVKTHPSQDELKAVADKIRAAM
ncbi:HIT family protein [Candidatus Uhrbacteria bacterium]|nr:HIT family protein [Candidatus Uhrbacteria bacterium]